MSVSNLRSPPFRLCYLYSLSQFTIQPACQVPIPVFNFLFRRNLPSPPTFLSLKFIPSRPSKLLFQCNFLSVRHSTGPTPVPPSKFPISDTFSGSRPDKGIVVPRVHRRPLIPLFRSFYHPLVSSYLGPIPFPKE